MNKNFSSNLYKQNDAIAKNAALDYLNNSRGYHFQENQDIFGTDLISGNIGIEVERRSQWHNTDFPYSFVHVPYRKLKQLGSTTALQNHFIVFNAECSKLVYVSSKTLREFVREENAVAINAFCDGEWIQDKVFRIPLDRCKVIDLTDNKFNQ